MNSKRTLSESRHQLKNNLLQSVVQPGQRGAGGQWEEEEEVEEKWKWSRREMKRSPEHLQWVGLMDLNTTSGTVVTVFKMLNDAALTDWRGDKRKPELNDCLSSQSTNQPITQPVHHPSIYPSIHHTNHSTSIQVIQPTVPSNQPSTQPSILCSCVCVPLTGV